MFALGQEQTPEDFVRNDIPMDYTKVFSLVAGAIGIAFLGAFIYSYVARK